MDQPGLLHDMSPLNLNIDTVQLTNESRPFTKCFVLVHTYSQFMFLPSYLHYSWFTYLPLACLVIASHMNAETSKQKVGSKGAESLGARCRRDRNYFQIKSLTAVNSLFWLRNAGAHEASSNLSATEQQEGFRSIKSRG